MDSLLLYILIEVPEAFLALMIGLAVFNRSIFTIWKPALLFSILFGAAGHGLSALEISYQSRVLLMFVLMNALILTIIKENIIASVFMSTTAFTANLLGEFLVITYFNLFQINLAEISQNPWYQYLASFSYLLSLLITGTILRLTKFDLRRLAPQKRDNRYLLLLVLVGSVEFLLIIFINTSYILNQNNTTFHLITSTEEQSFIQLLILALFLFMIFLFRTYLKLTINRVEEETETPYLQSIKDLLTAIRSIKHDAINHYTAINGFLKARFYDSGEEYVQHLLREATSIDQVVQAGDQIVNEIKNPAVSSLLHSKMAVCLADHITLYINITTQSQFSLIKTYDLIKVLGNLLDNAIRATLHEAEENRLIKLEWGQNEQEQFLVIENTGPTIPQEKFDEIFKLGFTTKKNEEGGVGLAIVKGVIDRYGGLIVIHSENGVTSFRVSFFS